MIEAMALWAFLCKTPNVCDVKKLRCEQVKVDSRSRLKCLVTFDIAARKKTKKVSLANL